ncbi:MAG: c-type cytochrome, partial [Verrucomicrobiota bacterium]|nr:c-type cytochrome [Verrucomicrobiota bacterium]
MKNFIFSYFLFASLPVLAQQEIDAVIEGKKAFETYGCVVCHAIDKADKSFRTGPNLYGLFHTDPRDREVVSAASGIKVKVKADKNYFLTSVRKSWDVLAVAESGPTRGKPFPKIMPMYAKEVIPDQSIEYIWHYLRTLSPKAHAGPSIVKLKQEKKEEPKSLLQVPNEILVTNRTRVVRAPLRESSGRALHVGFTNGMNYTFDPRVLSVRNVWAGGFLNLTQERSGRGRPGSSRGQGNRVFVKGGGILQPVTKSGSAVDFEFKEPDVMDHKAIEKWLWEDRDFLELLDSVDAEFKGHSIDSSTGSPVFAFRVGQNEMSQSVNLTDDGRIEFVINGALKEDQKFKLNRTGLSDFKVEGGKLAGNEWILNSGKKLNSYKLSAKLSGGLIARSI